MSGLILRSLVLIEQLQDVAEFADKLLLLSCVFSLLQVAEQECELSVEGIDVSGEVIELPVLVLLEQVALLFVALGVLDALLQLLILSDEVKGLLREHVPLEVLRGTCDSLYDLLLELECLVEELSGLLGRADQSLPQLLVELDNETSMFKLGFKIVVGVHVNIAGCLVPNFLKLLGVFLGDFCLF